MNEAGAMSISPSPQGNLFIFTELTPLASQESVIN